MTLWQVVQLFSSISWIEGIANGAGEEQGKPPLLLAALIGGSLGGWLGSRRLAPEGIKRALAVVLLVAGVKMLAL